MTATTRQATDARDQEAEILGLLAKRCTTAEIAATLSLDPAEVEREVQTLRLKLRAINRNAMVVAALRSGIVRPAALARARAAEPRAPATTASRPAPDA